MVIVNELLMCRLWHNDLTTVKATHCFGLDNGIEVVVDAMLCCMLYILLVLCSAGDVDGCSLN